MVKQIAASMHWPRWSIYFKQIVGNNSVNVHWIPTKLGNKIRLMSLLNVPKFQPDWSTHSCFMADLQSVQKVEEKMN